jgi:hypothetical protein
VSDWTYISLAYAIVWGGLAAYALALARRVFQAQTLERRLGEMQTHADSDAQGASCDVPPAP